MRVPFFEARKECSEKNALDLVEPRIDSERSADLFTTAAAPVARHRQAIARGRVVGRKATAIAQTRQVLGGIETIGDPARVRGKRLAAKLRAVRLARVLKQRAV